MQMGCVLIVKAKLVERVQFMNLNMVKKFRRSSSTKRVKCKLHRLNKHKGEKKHSEKSSSTSFLYQNEFGLFQK